MNKFRTRTMMRSAAAGLLLGFAACSSGGGGGSEPSFSLFSVDPAESVDLNGGDKVVIHGENFLAARVARVLFGDGNPGFNLTVLDDERIEVTVPPSPNGQPAIVTVEVETLEFGTKGIFGGFRYVGGGGPIGPPQPQTIFPTTFTPTGAQPFTIQGTNLGPGGGTVAVIFDGIGAVAGAVNNDGTIVTGHAPVTPGVPGAGSIQVTVDNSGEVGAVPTPVSYSYVAPTALPVPNQEGGDNASRPVRVSDGLAVMCTAGANFAWGDGNDDMLLIDGPPSTIQTRSALAGQPAANRHLDRNNSVPVVLDEDTICVYSPGPTAALGDEVILLITNLAAAAPTVQALPAPNAAPIPAARISANRVGFILRGTGAGGQDQLQVFTIVNGVFQGPLPSAVDVNFADPGGLLGRANFSIPFSPDGDSVFVYSSGFNGGFNDIDDEVYRHVISTGQTSVAPARFVLLKPIALSASRVATIAAGTAATPQDIDDQLAVIDFSPSVNVTHIDLNATADVVAPQPLVPLGTGGLVLVAGGPDRIANTADDVLAVFTGDGSGGFDRADAPLERRPNMTPLGNGGLVAFGRGVDGAADSGDDRAIFVQADGSSFLEFVMPPSWPMATAQLADSTRAFGIGNGLDGTPQTGDEELLVYQSSIVEAASGAATSRLPLSVDFNSPIRSALPANPIRFVPVGPGWGVIQSPGRNLAFLGADDMIVVVQY